MTSTIGFIQNIGMMEWAVILIIALLLFGKRLPEVGKSLGKGIVEFKKGLKGVEDDIDQRSAPNYQSQLPQSGPQTVPHAQAPTHGQPNTVGRSDSAQ
ncbi:MAG: twin-arginine translocase TatA/TatE family subunit [Phycisphaerales bacterium]|nr:twin-arginine translocase TatA/TatE family subunit [Phycisphaerales bacterium]